MRLEIENSQLDLGTTPIENMFINTYLSRANEIQIKVYLYALMNAYSGNTNISNLNIANEMGISEGQVIDSWNYWIDEGIVEIIDDRYIFKSVRFQYIKALAPSLSEMEFENEDSNSKTFAGEWTKNTLSEESIDSKEMIENIEQFISEGQNLEQKLNEREIKKLINLKNDFGVSGEFISYAYMMASNIREKKSVDPVVATMRNWMLDGATDFEKLELYLEKSSKEQEEKKAKKSTSKKQNLHEKDDRMSKEERLKFIEEKLKREIPIKRKDKK
ncbi:DnaD domain protein [uncultured Ezakiella sp.]|uniref:DnaD domain protein n=1 Tax=uncultured Ezakiella sp. TaxID=1637529 RepID=UPI0025F3F42A|nr:DnaD domain protein [uncultured Ezakiella sp.]